MGAPVEFGRDRYGNRPWMCHQRLHELNHLRVDPSPRMDEVLDRECLIIVQLGTGIFPELSMEWSTFKDVQRLMSKNSGKTWVPLTVCTVGVHI